MVNSDVFNWQLFVKITKGDKCSDMIPTNENNDNVSVHEVNLTF